MSANCAKNANCRGQGDWHRCVCSAAMTAAGVVTMFSGGKHLAVSPWVLRQRTVCRLCFLGRTPRFFTWGLSSASWGSCQVPRDEQMTRFFACGLRMTPRGGAVSWQLPNDRGPRLTPEGRVYLTTLPGCTTGYVGNGKLSGGRRVLPMGLFAGGPGKRREGKNPAGSSSPPTWCAGRRTSRRREVSSVHACHLDKPEMTPSGNGERSPWRVNGDSRPRSGKPPLRHGAAGQPPQS
jgi:hypothetical protein